MNIRTLNTNGLTSVIRKFHVCEQSIGSGKLMMQVVRQVVPLNEVAVIIHKFTEYKIHLSSSSHDIICRKIVLTQLSFRRFQAC